MWLFKNKKNFFLKNFLQNENKINIKSSLLNIKNNLINNIIESSKVTIIVKKNDHFDILNLSNFILYLIEIYYLIK